jgi:diguanylate cyclase (GGDEF)-like protein
MPQGGGMLRNWFFNQKINTTIILALSATLLLTVALSGYLHFNLQRQNYQKNLMDDHVQITSMLARSLQSPLLHRSKEAAKGIMDSFMLDPRMVEVGVWSIEADMLFSHTFMPERVQGKIYTQTQSILHQNKRLGEVVVKFASGPMEAELRTLFRTNVIHFFIQFTLSLLLLLSIFYLKITQPIKQLLHFVNALDDYQIRSGSLWPFKDEISTIGRAFERAKHTITTIAMSDPQTGIHNHYMLTRLLQNLFIQCRGRSTPFSILLIEIVNFKQINEAHGHLKGDAVLLSITQDIAQLKKSDHYFGRWGGSMLMLLCPNEDVRSIEPIASTLSRHLERTLYVEKISVTCVFGIAQVTPSDTDAEDLIKRANMAINKAKTSRYSTIITEA